MKILIVVLVSLLIIIAVVNVAEQENFVLEQCLENYALAAEIIERQHKIIKRYETMLERHFPLPKVDGVK